MDSSLCRHFQIEIEAAILTALRSNGISISEDDSQRFADTCTLIFFPFKCTMHAITRITIWCV